MPAAGTWITQADVENAIGTSTLIQLCDDNKDGVADLAVVQGIIDDAEAEVHSFISGIYTEPVLSTDKLIKLAAKEYAASFAYRRKPEYVVGDSDASTRIHAMYKRATERMIRIKDALQQLSDTKAAGNNPQNVQAKVDTGSSITPTDPIARTFLDGTGDF